MEAKILVVNTSVS